MQPTVEAAIPQGVNLLHKSDIPLLKSLGDNPMITADELAQLTDRMPSAMRRRLNQYQDSNLAQSIEPLDTRLAHLYDVKCPHCKHIIPISRRESQRKFQANWWYLTQKGAALVPDAGHLTAWTNKSLFHASHERGITLIAHTLRRAFGNDFHGWQRHPDDVAITVTLHGKEATFYPDAQGFVHSTKYYFENTRAKPRSENGVSDLDTKLERYNTVLEDMPNAKVVFLFPTNAEAQNFIAHAAKEYPYYWLWATSLPSLMDKPTGKIFWCAKDYEQRTYSFLGMKVE